MSVAGPALHEELPRGLTEVRFLPPSFLPVELMTCFKFWIASLLV